MEGTNAEEKPMIADKHEQFYNDEELMTPAQREAHQLNRLSLGQ